MGEYHSEGRNVQDAIQLDRFCDEFEVAWKTTPKLDLLEHVKRVPAKLKSDFVSEVAKMLWRLDPTGKQHPSLESYVGSNSQLADVVQRFTGTTPLVSAAEVDTERPAPANSVRSPVDANSEFHQLPIVTHYQLGDVLGRGGMGVVYEAYNRVLRRTVAIKLISPDIVHSGISARFLYEAVLAGQLQHPGICPVYEVGQIQLDGELLPFIAMKKVEGVTFSAWLHDQPADSVHRQLKVFADVCRAVGYAHSQGIVHRDLKPANVMIGAHGETLVMDWGLGKRLAEEPDSPGENTPISQPQNPTLNDGLSEHGAVKGTLAYMSPEQAQGQPVDARTDVFALGSMLCEMLTSKPIYQGTKSVTLQAARAGDTADARERLLTCSADQELKSLVLDCVQVQPESRPQSGQQVATIIDNYLNSVEVRLQEAEVQAARERGERRAARWRFITIIGVLCATMACIIVFQNRWQRAHSSFAQADRAWHETQNHLAMVNSEPWNSARWDQVVTRAKAAKDAGAEGQATLGFLQSLSAEIADNKTYRELYTQLVREQQLVLALRDARLASGKYRAGTELYDYQTMIKQYEQAFATFGIDLNNDSIQAIADKINSCHVPAPLIAALDDMMLRIRRGVKSELTTGRVAEILAHVDDDQVRQQLRAAVIAGDKDQLVKLAESWAVAQHPIGTTMMLAEAVHKSQLAINLLTQVVDANPRSFWGHTLLGIMHAMAHPADRTAATRHYQLATLLSANVDSLSKLGFSLHLEGRLDEAERAYRKVLQLKPTDYQTHSNLGSLKNLAGDLPAAITAFRAAIRLQPKNHRLHYNLGTVLAKQGKRKEAMSTYRTAVRLRPDYGTAYHNIGVMLDEANELEKAVQVYSIAVKHGHTSSQLNLAANLVLLGRFREAVEAGAEGNRTGTERGRRLRCFGRRTYGTRSTGRSDSATY